MCLICWMQYVYYHWIKEWCRIKLMQMLFWIAVVYWIMKLLSWLQTLDLVILFIGGILICLTERCSVSSGKILQWFFIKSFKVQDKETNDFP